MKRIICSIYLSTVALALPVLAEEHQGGAAAAPAVHTRAAVHQSGGGFEPMRVQGNVSGTRFRSRTYVATPRVNANVTTNRAVVRNQYNPETVRPRTVTTTGERFNARNNRVSVNRTNNINRTRNVSVTNNWRSARFNGGQYSAFRNYRRTFHDRSWWRNHYHNIVFVDGGWYYWDAPYWFPAWGYDSTAYYPYDGPIYGYNQLAPDRVIVDVQSQLQQDGYYSGQIDGVLGPATRQAIAAFQADHDLAITSAIDEPTLSTLGLT